MFGFGLRKSLSFEKYWYCVYTYEQLFAVDLCFRNSSWMKRMPGVSNLKSLSWVPSSESWRTGTHCCQRREMSWWVQRQSMVVTLCGCAAMAVSCPQNIKIFSPVLFGNHCRSSCLLLKLCIWWYATSHSSSLRQQWIFKMALAGMIFIYFFKINTLPTWYTCCTGWIPHKGGTICFPWKIPRGFDQFFFALGENTDSMTVKENY